MTTVEEAIRQTLENDAELMAVAVAGVHDASTVGRNGMTVDYLKNDDDPQIHPGIYIKWSSIQPWPEAEATLQASRGFLEVYFYQEMRFDCIQTMRRRVLELLHHQRVEIDEPAGDYVCEIIWAGDTLNQVDEAMAGVSFERSRYSVVMTRRSV
jgi:hypothetical protein